jgi:glycosyltransferase involved in cell wall biosynthesis
MPAKILFLITDLNLGGTEKILFEITKRLDKNKFIPVIFGLKGWGIYAEQMANVGIEVHAMGVSRFGTAGFPFLWLSAIAKMAGYARANGIGLIHSFLFQGNLAGRIVSRLSGRIPVVSSIRVIEEEKKWQLTVEKFFSKTSAVITANSLALKEFLVNNRVADASKIEVIYNGIDVSHLPAPDRDWLEGEFSLGKNDFVFVTAGRLHRQKGLRYLIEATAVLTGSNPGARCVIVGDGPERAALSDKCRSLGLTESGKVIFAGKREPTETLRIMASSDAFVLASEWEGTPNAVLEAMALGKPVVATGVGGTVELIENGKDGLLVPPRDAAALSNAMAMIISDRSAALAMGAEARGKVERNFSMEKMIKRTEELYRKVLLGATTR